jgi:hypothetical protein
MCGEGFRPWVQAASVEKKKEKAGSSILYALFLWKTTKDKIDYHG